MDLTNETKDDIMYSLVVDARADGKLLMRVTPDEAQVTLADLILMAEYARDMIMQQVYITQRKEEDDAL